MSLGSDSQSGESLTGHVSMTKMKKADPHVTRWGDFLKATIKFEASDLIMKSEQPPKLRIRGALKPLDTPPVGIDEFWKITETILSEDQLGDLQKFGSVDFAYDYDDRCRFRVNLF